jgi:polyphenol oxidase
MPFYEHEGIRYYTFPSFYEFPLIHGVLTRDGGASVAPWASLNLGGTVGDAPDHVHENRRRAFHGMGLRLDAMYDVWQVHSAEVVATDRPRHPTTPHLEADAILTDRPGLSLFMRFADCVPIMLYDPKRRAIGLVHAGWKGTLSQVAARAVEGLHTAYRSNPADILAAIGPSIGAHHYEVGLEVAAQVRQAFGAEATGLLISIDNRPEVQFDLWNANRLVLERAGVKQVEIAGICTACHLEDWYSHRGEHGKTGRFGAVISLL